MKKKDNTDALKNLPAHTPPETVWLAIEKTISEDRNLNRQLKKLKEHTPEENAWAGIESGLKTKRFTVSILYKWAIAASVAVFLLAGGWLFSLRNQQKGNLEAVIENYHSDTDDAFSTLEAFCVNQNIVRSEPRFTSLKSEYERLKKEELEVRAKAGEFKSEKDLLRKLNGIEEKKTDVLNQMANLI